MDLREGWKRVARADRFVYGAALVLVGTSFLVHVRAIAAHFDQADPWLTTAAPVVLPPNTFEKNGQGLILGVAVLVVLGWEVAKEGYRFLSDAGPIKVGVLVAVPVAAPLTALASWLASLLARNMPEHPLLEHALPLPVGVGITVYLITTALVIVGLKELRDRHQPETP